MKINIGDVKVVMPSAAPSGKRSHEQDGLIGKFRSKALEKFMRGQDFQGLQFWYVPAHGGARQLKNRDEVDWRSSGIMTKAEADAFDEAEAADPGPPTVNVSTASITAADDDVDDETVEAPTLSVHQETDTECSPAAPCGTCRRREAGVPVAGIEKTCGCLGLGVSVEWNGSTSEPEYIVSACDEHQLAFVADPGRLNPEVDAASDRLEEILKAVADVRDLVFGGLVNGSSRDTLVEITERLAFLKPNWR